MRIEDQAMLKQLLRMRKTITKIKKEEEEWKLWEARYRQGDYSFEEEPESPRQVARRSAVIPGTKLKLQNGTVTPTKTRTLPAPGRQYRQAFIPSPMSPTSPSPSPSSSMDSFNLTGNSSDGTVNDSSLMRDFSFQLISPLKGTPSPGKLPATSGKQYRAQSMPNCHLPPPPPPEVGESSGPKYGPVMRRTWSMDNVVAASHRHSTSSDDSGVLLGSGNGKKNRDSGSDFSAKVHRGRPSSTSSISSSVCTDGGYRSRSESPSSDRPSATHFRIPTCIITSDSEVDAVQLRRPTDFVRSHSDSGVQDKTHSRHPGIQIQKLATIVDESPTDMRMMAEWGRAEGNCHFVLDRRAQRAMARQDMISSKPTSPPSPKPPPKPPRQLPQKPAVPRDSGRMKPTLRSQSLEPQPFHSPQPHRRTRTISDNFLSTSEIYRTTSENMLSSVGNRHGQALGQHNRQQPGHGLGLSIPQVHRLKSKSMDRIVDVAQSTPVHNQWSPLCPGRRQPSPSPRRRSEEGTKLRHSFMFSPDTLVTDLWIPWKICYFKQSFILKIWNGTVYSSVSWQRDTGWWSACFVLFLSIVVTVYIGSRVFLIIVH